MRLLLVEDEQPIIDFLRPVLEAERFTVDVAKDGWMGSQLACTNVYDIIVLDNVLPHKTGLEICGEVRAAGSKVPIIMLSVRTEPAMKVTLLNAGANDYLSKPFSFDELLARIRVQLRPLRDSESDMLVVDDLILNTERRCARRGRQELPLNNKECTLLAYMMHNSGSILTRNMLMEHVWDMPVDPLSRTIDAHIRNLRKKIDLPGMRKLIHTQIGRGYWIGPTK